MSTAVLKLAGVECVECLGMLFPHASNLYTLQEPDGCRTCNGTGYHLSGATRENWPFWGLPIDTVWHPDHIEQAKDTIGHAYMPDFPTDGNAALWLAEHMAAQASCEEQAFIISKGKYLVINTGNEKHWGKTLGEALLAALDNIQEETK